MFWASGCSLNLLVQKTLTQFLRGSGWETTSLLSSSSGNLDSSLGLCWHAGGLGKSPITEIGGQRSQPPHQATSDVTLAWGNGDLNTVPYLVSTNTTVGRGDLLPLSRSNSPHGINWYHSNWKVKGYLVTIRWGLKSKLPLWSLWTL